jgi:hypothetical protein
MTGPQAPPGERSRGPHDPGADTKPNGSRITDAGDRIADALGAAKRSWAVFPLPPRDKVPRVKWRDVSTDDVQTIAAEFAGRVLNYGIDCGKSGLVIIDEDKPGEFQRWAGDHSHTIPATFTVRTAHGRHWYFTPPSGATITNKDATFTGYAINVRGTGGYVVGPGSVHPSGAVYTAENVLDPAPMPQWLVDALTGDDGLATVTGPFELPAVITSSAVHGPPTRDDTLYKYACSLRAKGVRITQSVKLMREAWERCEQPPGHHYPWGKALEKIDRAWSYDYTSPNGAAPTAPPQAVNELPPLIRLDEFLATPDEELAYRVDQLWPTGGRVILAAAWKAGKTTLLGNLIRALVDAQPFLGRYTVQPADRVVLIDDELDKRTLRRWLREQGISSTERVELVALRGKVATFNIIDAETRARWARHISAGDVLLFDCLRPVLDALGLDESHDAGRFLVAFDALLAEAGIREAGIAHHMGHVGERSRGDSRLRDWPDVEWRLVRDKSNDEDGDTDPAAPRYFAAYGRDVDQPEQLLGYDPAARRLTIAGGTRKDTKAEALIDAVVRYVTDESGCSQSALEKAVGGHAADVRKARDRAVERGLINVEKVGRRRAHTLCSSNSSNSSGRVDELPFTTRPSVLYGDEVEGATHGQPAEINNSPDVDEQPPPPDDDPLTDEDWAYWTRMAEEQTA